jgi:hypothetical protein
MFLKVELNLGSLHQFTVVGYGIGGFFSSKMTTPVRYLDVP